MKKLTKDNRSLLKEALVKINRGIHYYKNEGCNEIYPEGMCTFMNDLNLSMEEDRIFTAFITTKPKPIDYQLYWYPRHELLSRINHLTKIKNEIKTVLKNGYY